MITFAAPGDTFWDKVRSGATAAAEKDNIDLKYSSDPQVAGQSTLIQNAVDSKVDGIAVAMANPDGLAPAIKAATDAGIPVVGFNSGIDKAFDVGALMFFGSDEQLAGESVGKRIAEAGGKHPLCVIMEQGQTALETRCAGVKSAAPGDREHQRGRHRHAVGGFLGQRQAAAGPVHRLGRHPRRTVRDGRARHRQRQRAGSWPRSI